MVAATGSENSDLLERVLNLFHILHQGSKYALACAARVSRYRSTRGDHECLEELGPVGDEYGDKDTTRPFQPLHDLRDFILDLTKSKKCVSEFSGLRVGGDNGGRERVGVATGGEVEFCPGKRSRLSKRNRSTHLHVL